MNLTLTHDKLPQLKAIISAMELLPVGSQVDIPQSFFASPALKTLVEQPIEEEEVEAPVAEAPPVSVGVMAPVQARGYATVTGNAVVEPPKVYLLSADISNRLGCSYTTWHNRWAKVMKGLPSTYVYGGTYRYAEEEVREVLSRHGLKLLKDGDYYIRSSKMRELFNIPETVWNDRIANKVRELPSFVKFENIHMFSRKEAGDLLKSMGYIK